MSTALLVTAGAVALVSLLLAPRAASHGAFFRGLSEAGAPPGLATLVLSQVTTWIFARSLMNAAILGFHYGIWGTLAYALYYLSFVSGGLIIDSLRFRHGHASIQDFLGARFGRWGTACYNVLVGVRLISEVFANLLVIGILFGAEGSGLYTAAIVGFAVVTLGYSMMGGLRASLRTDVFQMLLLVATLGVLIAMGVAGGTLRADALFATPFVPTDPGPVLMLVALLQVLSYPMHDPVMMDRGFLADRRTTRLSFLHATWLSMVLVVAFGALGVAAGADARAGEDMNAALTRLLGDVPMLLFGAALVISAMSTLDSTLSSAAKLVAVDMGLGAERVDRGRLVMALFMALGLALVFWGSKDLFAAVAVSGTAALYLAPVVLFSLWGGRRDVPLWSYLGAFVLALGGAALYFTESAGHTGWLGEAHKYTKLLGISVAVLAGGCALFVAGIGSRRWRR